MRTWDRLRTTPLVTSNYVLDETFTLMARRVGYGFAAERAERFYASEAFEIVSAVREDELTAVHLFKKFAHQEVSFTDCISFAIMRRHGVATAFTFDRHFLHAGFNVIGLQ
jgi:uncharacterized protein